MAVLAVGGALWCPLWGLLGLELLAYVAAGGYMAARAGRDVQASPLLVLVAFAQLHVSYGLGLLWGFLTAPVKFGLRPPAGPGQALAERRRLESVRVHGRIPAFFAVTHLPGRGCERGRYLERVAGWALGR